MGCKWSVLAVPRRSVGGSCCPGHPSLSLRGNPAWTSWWTNLTAS
jgi:hypothetical protein